MSLQISDAMSLRLPNVSLPDHRNQNVEQKLDAIIATQAFHAAEMKRLEQKLQAVISELSSNYVGQEAHLKAILSILKA